MQKLVSDSGQTFTFMDTNTGALTSPATGIQRIFWLDVARVIAIISISLNHAVNRVFDNYVDQQADFFASPFASTLLKTTVTVFSRYGVPLFLMISGALLLQKHITDEGGIRRFYRHNLLGLLITSEIWFFIMFWFLVFATPDQPYLVGATVPQLLLRMVRTLLMINPITFSSTWYIAIVIPLYLLIPFLAILRWNVSAKIAAVPLCLIAVMYTVIPSINAVLNLAGFDYAIEFSPSYYGASSNLSGYILYVCVGHWISQGGLDRVSTWLLAAGCVLLFAGTCYVQYHAYAQPANYLASYDFFGIVLGSMITFELIRRGARFLRSLKRPIAYLSKISFGIYFVHILIMSLLYWYTDIGWGSRTLTLFLYEFLSIGCSVIFIAVLSQAPVLKKYMFMIKD